MASHVIEYLTRTGESRTPWATTRKRHTSRTAKILVVSGEGGSSIADGQSVGERPSPHPA